MKLISIICAICLGISGLWRIIIQPIFYGYSNSWDNLFFQIIFYVPLTIFFIKFSTICDNFISNNDSSSKSNQEKTIESNKSNEGAGGIKWLCFLIPILGLILYLVWQTDKPIAAKECGKFAIIGLVVSFALGIVSFIASMAYINSIY